ncbi:MAG: HAD hydrolase-like protein [Clostridiales bacterium]|jgi:phosphoglycolate phosphatase-like HAD superfamily hydrolase|nr:HAD hydrolase-like protein [Clostridiales bacterium]
MYSVILFDLDGTLTDPLEGITNSALYALDKMKIDAGDMASFKVLQHFQLDNYFSMVIGSNLDGTRSAKAEIIKCILDTLPGVPKEAVVMVGDRMFDIDGARANGIDSVGVTYGFGTGEELTAARPDYLASSVAQLKRILAGGESCPGDLQE